MQIILVLRKILPFINIATGNAIANATVPVMDSFCAGEKNAYTTLDASGLSVGLPAGLMGNSEVGHLNIGAGRVVYQVTLLQEYACKKFFCTCAPKLFTLLELLTLYTTLRAVGFSYAK